MHEMFIVTISNGHLALVILLLQKRNTSSLLDQLLIKLKVDDLDLSTQLSSSAAAAYDSVWALALACSRIVMNNATISMESIIGELKLMSIRGMAVSCLT